MYVSISNTVGDGSFSTPLWNSDQVTIIPPEDITNLIQQGRRQAHRIRSGRVQIEPPHAATLLSLFDYWASFKEGQVVQVGGRYIKTQDLIVRSPEGMVLGTWEEYTKGEKIV